MHNPTETSHALELTWRHSVTSILCGACLAATGCGQSGAPPPDFGNPNQDASTSSTLPGANSDAGVACETPAPTACPTPSPTFGDVEPIIETHCLECHYGEPEGPWPLTSYEHVVDWFDIIRASMLRCTMPPPEASTTMTIEERV